MQPKYLINGSTHLVTPIKRNGDISIAVDGHRLTARMHWRDANEAELTVNGVTRRVYVAQDDRKLFVHLDGRVWQLTAVDEFADAKTGSSDSDGALLAPMPGVVVEVTASVGQRVAIGDSLMLIESMKLQSEIKAKINGTVSRIAVTAGASFERNSVLINIEADAESVEGKNP